MKPQLKMNVETNKYNNIIKKKYTLTDTVLLGIGGMIGGGIFLFNGVIVKEIQNYSPLTWLIGFIISLFVSFSYILLSQEYPKSNGGTIYYSYKLIKNKTFNVIFSILVVIAYTILATVYSLALSNYVCNYYNKPEYSKIIAIITIFLCLFINYFNENKFISIENISVLMKIVLFLFIIIVGFILSPKTKLVENTISNTISEILPSKINNNNLFNINILIIGFGVFLTYEGFEMISNVTYKLENKDKNIPLSYIISICIVGFIYMSTSWVTYKHVGSSLSSSTQFSALIHLVQSYGLTTIGPILVVILCFISSITAINATLFVNDRILNYFVKSLPEKDTFKFKTFLNSQIKIPLFKEKRKSAIWIFCILSCILVFAPIIIISYLGSLSFFLVFIVVCFLALKLINIKETKKKHIIIFNKKIPYSLSKSIVIISIILCSIGSIFIIYDSIKKIKN